MYVLLLDWLELTNYILTEKKNQTVMFDSINDWRQELERTKGNLKFKAVSSNENYNVSKK